LKRHATIRPLFGAFHHGQANVGDLEVVLHVKTADVWMGVVSTKSPNFRIEGELDPRAIRARPHKLQPDDGRWKELTGTEHFPAAAKEVAFIFFLSTLSSNRVTSGNTLVSIALRLRFFAAETRTRIFATIRSHRVPHFSQSG